MKRIISSLIIGLLFSATALAQDLKASSAAKTFKGPEGELITTVEMNNSQEILIDFNNVTGDLNGKTELYKLKDLGQDRFDAFYEVKRGSKTNPHNILGKRNGGWIFWNPARPGQDLRLTYSEADSKKANIEELIKKHKTTKEKK